MNKRRALTALILAGAVGLALPQGASAHERRDGDHPHYRTAPIERYYAWHIRELPRYAPYGQAHGWQQRDDHWRRHTAYREGSGVQIHIDLSDRF